VTSPLPALPGPSAPAIVSRSTCDHPASPVLHGFLELAQSVLWDRDPLAAEFGMSVTFGVFGGEGDSALFLPYAGDVSRAIVSLSSGAVPANISSSAWIVFCGIRSTG